MSSKSLSIALHQNVASLFANPNGDSATKLAALINKNLGSEGFKQSTASLDALLSSITNQLNLSSFAHRETIDDYVNFVAFTSLQINNQATHPGTILKEGEQPLYRVAPLHPASGPGILGQNLAKTMFDSLWDATSRAVTPDVDTDRDQPKEYYYKASIYATVLARAFALAESFRDSLWRDVEDVLVKGLFSGDEQEPGVFVALTAILLGAGKEIEAYLNGEDKGQGKNWLWYDDVRTESDSTWGWKDVVGALKSQPGPEMMDRLPEYVKDNIELAKKHVASGEGSWDSKRLASEAFRWASIDS
ncbi:hypothetical protein P691DRAFT_809411 [Macrolepiota fuliginosa MF-IS2]|uniref:Uncharacterized protein n=1 Tax=Macrolepiota fuliginosa MF-IS2 TaxID=1400762 RepID=A0A9P6BYZ2_9AGAR|nr:hypothetical protein P691DRAFT_809411 [Macrolepiota fuliginosa MF-IS2]